MNILTTNRKGGPYETIEHYMKTALTSSEYELELIYGSHPRNTLKKIEFIRVLDYLKQNYKFQSETNNLDIKLQNIKLEKSGFSDIRCTISGVQNIKKYCKTNSIIDIPTTTFLKKLSNKDDKNPSLTFNQIKNTDYNFRINLKKEISLDDSDEDVIKFKDNLKDGLKYYRYKKRYSFLSSDNLFRIDLTAVKSNTYNPKRKSYNLSKNLVDSRILSGKEIYELEIEYIGYNEIDGKYPIDIFSKKVYSEWGSDKMMTEEDYDTQVVLSEYNLNPFLPQSSFSGTVDTFTPECDNIYVGEDDLGWDYSGTFVPDESIYEEVSEPLKEVVEMDKPGMKTAWGLASTNSWRGEVMDLIYMNYWHDRGGWLFLGITNYGKQVLFDGVEENYTDKYKNAPKNKNYVKYIVYPPFTEEEIKELKEKDLKGESNSFYGEYEDGFENKFNVPFSQIYGLDEKDDQGSSHMGLKEWSDQKGGGNKLPSWAPKSKLSRDGRFIDTVNLKLNEIITKLLVIIHERNIIVSNRKKNQILDEYKTLTEQNTERVNFIGPNPVSMSLDELNTNNPHSILNGYVVTEKADGIRAELFIDKTENGYLITQKKEIIYTGLIFKGIGNCILDGEYITKDRNGKDIQLFMIFDIYYLDSGEYPNHPFTLPWIGKKKNDICRSSILYNFKTKVEISSGEIKSLKDGIYIFNWKPDLSGGSNNPYKIENKDMIRIGYKQYYEGPKVLKKNKKDPLNYTNLNGIGKVSKKILNLDKKDNYEYSIDGLIYMPMYYPVGSNNEELIKDNINGTWYQNYKWKPPEENTIDFRIKFIKEEFKGRKVNKITSFTKNKKTIQCQQVNLYVGYDIKKDIITDFTWKVMGCDKRQTNEILFNPPSEKDSIHICNIPLTKNKLLCSKDKSEVIDNFIYEMRYIPENPFGYQWQPLRVREDKTRPNDSHTADNVWSTIQNPVTKELIEGKGDINNLSESVKKENLEEYSYYMDYSEDTDIDIPLRVFHNYIKSKLINSITSLDNKPISILDTSIGQGGDIGKYLLSKNSISFMLGLDISPDINKAAKRFYIKKDKPKALFIQYDTSKSISGGEGCVGDHIERNKLIIDILYDRQKKLPKELRPLVPKYKGLCKKGFDLISSQFSIHYYFSDELTLRSYIQNISENLKKGGYFIGTCYDGMKVFQRLSKLEDGHLEMIDEFGNKVYSITKKYEIKDFTYSKDKKEELLGQEIDVYMNSIGKTFTEYLVNFEYFIEIMKEYDLELSKCNFKEEYKELFDNKDLKYTDGFGGFEMMIEHLNKLYSKDLSLKQYYPEAFGLLKEKNKLLRELSSLNNWFIFQKK